MSLSYLGKQLLNVFAFIDSAFKGESECKDAITGQVVRLSEMFQQSNELHILRQDSIPGSVALKAVAANTGYLFVECSPLDMSAVNRIMKEEMLPFRYKTGRHAFFDLTTQKPIIGVGRTITPTTDSGEELEPRCLLTIPLKPLNAARREQVTRLLDSIYSSDAFLSPKDQKFRDAESDDGKRGEPRKLSLKLNLSLMHELQLEQRAILSLNRELDVRPELKLDMGLQLLFTAQRRILQLLGAGKEEELAEYLADYANQRGKRELITLIDFVNAGKIKTRFPQLSWQQARQFARTDFQKRKSA